MTTGHRNREEDRLVAGIAGALEAVHLVHRDLLRSGPAGTAVTAQPVIVDGKLLDPTCIVQLSHPLDKRVHRPSHRSTLTVSASDRRSAAECRVAAEADAGAGEDQDHGGDGD